MGLRYYLRVLNNMSVKRISSAVNTVHNKSGKAKILTALDMMGCAAKYGAGPSDYVLFEYYNMNAKERKTYLGRIKSKKLISRLNDSEYSVFFDKKSEFAKKFKDFLGREVLDINSASLDEFKEFLKDKQYFLAKPDSGECGHGIEKVDKSKFSDETELFNYLKGKKFGVCEEIIKQHEDLARLHADSLNCIRVTTLLKDGKVHILYGVLKMGSDGGYVDNLDGGGIACHVDMDTGKVISHGHLGDYSSVEKHPCTNVEILGVKIPYFEEIKNMVKQAALVVPQVKYIGWDVCVTPTGPAIVEGNDYPGYDLPQIPDINLKRVGLIPKFKELGVTV